MAALTASAGKGEPEVIVVHAATADPSALTAIAGEITSDSKPEIEELGCQPCPCGRSAARRSFCVDPSSLTVRLQIAKAFPAALIPSRGY